MIDVTLSEAAFKGWSTQNPTKLPWNKDPELCGMSRCGMTVDNIVSTAEARQALRLRRLIGVPFAKKFLLDQEHLFKESTKKMIETLEQLRESQDGKIDITPQFRKYAFDLISFQLLFFFSNCSY
jgi:hypothetical protein